MHVGVGSPPLQSFYDAGVQVAFGTDSLASVADLNMFNELAEARRIAPRVPARRLLESATLTGARALGVDAVLIGEALMRAEEPEVAVRELTRDEEATREHYLERASDGGDSVPADRDS